MTSVRHALAFSLVERYLALVLALASTVLLARLLTPEEIGIYSVSLALIGVAQVLRDFGIGNFLIQEKNLDEDHIRTAFGFSLLLGGSLFVLMVLLAPLASRFYGESRMVETMRISALNFAVLPFCTISLALLRREMQFQKLLYVSLAASVLGFCVTVGMALGGWGANSMAAGSVVSNAATGFGAWIAQSKRQILRPALSRWRQLLNFGGQSALTNAITSVSMDINDLFLGKILGFAPVAIFSRAQGLVNLFNRDLMGAVRNVVYPAFAQAHRNGEMVETRYVQAVGNVLAFAWPFFAFIAVFPLEVLRLLYGPQWDAAAALVPMLAMAGALYATSNMVLNVVMAIGRIDIVTRFELVFQPLRAGLIILAAVVYESLAACAAAYLLAFILYAPLAYWLKQRCLPNDWAALRQVLLRSALLTVITLAVPTMLRVSHGHEGGAPLPWTWFAAAVACSVLGWVAGLYLSRHPLGQDPLLQRWLGRLLPWRPGKQH